MQIMSLHSLHIQNFNIISNNINISNYHPVCDISISSPPQMFHVYVSLCDSQNCKSESSQLAYASREKNSLREEFTQDSLFYARMASQRANLMVKSRDRTACISMKIEFTTMAVSQQIIPV